MTDNLISRREAHKVIRYYSKLKAGAPITLLHDMLDIIKAVDAVPVRHGKWIPCAKSGLILTEQMRKEGIRWYGFKCSACNFVRKGNAPRDANYCECCGARMDEE